MVKNIDELQKYGKDGMDAALNSFGIVQKGFQALAVEAAEYSKKSYEQGTAALEKLLAAKSFDKAIEIQSDYVKSAYEAFVGEATRVGELYADLAKESYRPFEGYFGKLPTMKA